MCLSDFKFLELGLLSNLNIILVRLFIIYLFFDVFLFNFWENIRTISFFYEINPLFEYNTISFLEVFLFFISAHIFDSATILSFVRRVILILKSITKSFFCLKIALISHLIGFALLDMNGLVVGRLGIWVNLISFGIWLILRRLLAWFDLSLKGLHHLQIDIFVGPN